MDVDNLLRGQSYAELKESYVIFICTQDPFAKACPFILSAVYAVRTAVFFLMTKASKCFILFST